MMPGYKQTEVGTIPVDWAVTQVGQATAKVGSGITPTGGNRVYKSEGRKFIRSQNVGWGVLILEDVAFISDETHSTFAETEIKSGDVFLNITGASIGRSALADSRVERGNVNQHVCIVRPDYLQLTSKFLNFVFLSALGQRQIDSFQAGGNRQGLNFAQVRSIRIPLPSATEQAAISTALSAIDALLDSLDRLIAKKRDLKQAAMQQLLTGQTRLPGFSGKWEARRLGDQASFFKGKGLPKSEISDSGRNKCIHYGELFTLYPENISQIFSRTDTIDGMFRSKKNDVLMPTSDVTPRGLAKASCIKEDGVVLGGDILVIRPDAKIVLGSFLSYVIRHQESQVLQLVTGSTVYHLYGSDMKKFIFSAPSVSEQIAIIEILEVMGQELIDLEMRRNKTAALKQGMMQELLTGRTRLV